MDIESNPGPIPPRHNNRFTNSLFFFCNWNLNTLSKNDFQRISLIEAYNTIFNYDIISLCETSLNDSTKVPDSAFKGYQFYPSNHPSGDKKGGVGIFYKD